MDRSLQHSAKGSTWTKKNHKYLRKEGNRYIYPEDVQSQLSQKGRQKSVFYSNKVDEANRRMDERQKELDEKRRLETIKRLDEAQNSKQVKVNSMRLQANHQNRVKYENARKQEMLNRVGQHVQQNQNHKPSTVKNPSGPTMDRVAKVKYNIFGKRIVDTKKQKKKGQNAIQKYFEKRRLAREAKRQYKQVQKEAKKEQKRIEYNRKLGKKEWKKEVNKNIPLSMRLKRDIKNLTYRKPKYK